MKRLRLCGVVPGLLALTVLIFLHPAHAAGRDRVEAFLEVTGFGVALDSIALSASDAPSMLGREPGDFGHDWTRVSREVFDTGVMRSMALGFLENALTEELLDHAAGFYASDLGRRLVEAENIAHMDDNDEAKRKDGEEIVAGLLKQGSPRLEYLKRMNTAIDSSDTAVRAVQEIQVRFLMAAASAGVIDLRLDEPALRAVMKENEGDMRRQMAVSALANAAHVYRAFSDADMRAYAEALEDERMQQVYELMNAVQWEIMANRFEVLAHRMANLHPGQDL
ncbi:MAG: hypothetical protein CSA70_08305 [Rhodobacterales bacterium]|nr:MAG: hypothetical protein CSA70_08305 [Rhodobacterales bacterium]